MSLTCRLVKLQDQNSYQVNIKIARLDKIYPSTPQHFYDTKNCHFLSDITLSLTTRDYIFAIVILVKIMK